MKKNEISLAQEMLKRFREMYSDSELDELLEQSTAALLKRFPDLEAIVRDSEDLFVLTLTRETLFSLLAEYPQNSKIKTLLNRVISKVRSLK